MIKEKLQLRDAVELVVGDKDTDSIHSGATHFELYQAYASLREVTHVEFIQVLAIEIAVGLYCYITSDDM